MTRISGLNVALTRGSVVQETANKVKIVVDAAKPNTASNVSTIIEKELQTKKSAVRRKMVTDMWRCSSVLSGAPGGAGFIR